jgi:hypothetical protein
LGASWIRPREAAAEKEIVKVLFQQALVSLPVTGKVLHDVPYTTVHATWRRASLTLTGTVVSERTYPGADTTTGVAVSGDRLLVTNSLMDTYLYGTPLTSPVFTIESLPLR